jgi:hypothetical protein
VVDNNDLLISFYNDLEADVVPYENHHKDRLQCKKGCSDCCVDDMTVFEIEANYIVKNCSQVLQESPHPVGACAFLNAFGVCRIYAYRPYVCRTQGLPLRWLDEVDAQMVEFRDICSLNETEEPIEILPADQCWEIGPYEGRLAMLQMQADGGKMRRVSLRSLFERVDT